MRCPHCGLTEHTRSMYPTTCRICNGCRGVRNFQSVYPKKPGSFQRPNNRQLKLFRMSRTAAPKITVETQLVTEEKPSKLLWFPAPAATSKLSTSSTSLRLTDSFITSLRTRTQFWQQKEFSCRGLARFEQPWPWDAHHVKRPFMCMMV